MSWPTVELGDICQIYQPTTLSKAKFDLSGPYPVYGANGIIGSHSEFNHEESQLLIGCRGSCGTVHLSEPNSWINGNAMVIRPKNPKQLHLKYLMYLFKGAIDLKKIITGVAQPQITRQKLSPLKISLPPLEHQEYVAKVLDNAEEITLRRELATEKLEILKQNLFLDMFGDPIQNPKNFDLYTLKDVVKKIQIGPFGTQLHEADYVVGGIPLINPSHIKMGQIQPNDAYTVTNQKHAELSQYHLDVGDVILGRRGEMGRCAVINDSQIGWLCGTGSLFLRVDPSKILPIYLQQVLSSTSMRNKLESVSQGVTMANLNKDIVGSLKIFIPPMSAQIKFNAALTSISLLEEKFILNACKTEKLLHSMHSQLFSN